MAANEFIAGVPIQITLTFVDEISGALVDPSTVNGYIQLGVGPPTTTFALPGSDLVKLSLGVWYYVFVTVGATPGYYTVQAQSSGTVAGISDPAVFTILAPSIAGLT